MPKSWTTRTSEVVLETHSAVIRRDHVDLPNGRSIEDYYVFEFKEWATIIPITDSGEVVLVKQYRHGSEQVTMEFPAGLINPEDADPFQAARRELVEETGFAAADWTYLGAYSLGPSTIRNQFHLYCARGCRRVSPQQLDDLEDIEVITLPLAQVEQMIRQGEINDVNSTLAWLLCKNNRLIP